MSRFIKKHKHEIGVSPDDLIFRGDKKIDEVLLRIIDYDANNLDENAISTINDVLKYQEKDSVTWFNVDGLHNNTIMEEIAKGFKLITLY